MNRASSWSLALLLAVVQIASTEPRSAASYFDRGATFDDFMQGVVAQRTQWEANLGRAGPSAALVERLRGVRRGLRFLVVAEDWCPDSVNILPDVAKLAAAASVELRVIHRAEGGSVMARHRTPDGRVATPTIVLLRDGREAGAWVERPVILQQAFLTMANNPESVKLMENRQAWYDADGGVTALTEIVALAERMAAR